LILRGSAERRDGVGGTASAGRRDGVGGTAGRRDGFRAIWRTGYLDQIQDSGLGIRDWGFGTGDSGLGIRDWGFGTGDSGLGIRDSGFGTGDSGLRMSE
jgi:hypothetical protein